jgi:L-lysine 2,3-aminomutase
VVNQCPLVRGVNDDPAVLADLFTTMTRLGAPQYYLFQGRPTAGNEAYEVPLVEGWEIFDAARSQCSGLSRRVRFAMSHASGKIEILGLDQDHIYLRYHRARDPRDESRILVRARDDRAHWLDELAPAH